MVQKFFLVPQREFDGKEKIEDKQSIHGSVPKNRSECLIWWVTGLCLLSLILSHASFSRNNGAKKHFRKFHAASILPGWFDNMTNTEIEDSLLNQNHCWTDFIRLIETRWSRQWPDFWCISGRRHICGRRHISRRRHISGRRHISWRSSNS